MSDDNFAGLDLNLLKVFVLIMQERSLTRAARRLSVGQPAVSHALARLRTEFDDVLFVRLRGTMEPTERARALYAQFLPALEQIRRSVVSSRTFDPRTTARTFSIGMSDDLQLAFLPRVLGELTRHMPNARFVVQHVTYINAPEKLSRNEVGMVVGYLDGLPAAAKVRKLRTAGYRAVTAAQDDRRMDLPRYCAGRHLLVTFAGDLVGYIDETLHRLGVAREIALSLSNFAVVPFILREIGHIATVPDYLAQVLAAQPDLEMHSLPFASPEFDISIAWNLTTDGDPGDKLVRDRIAAIVGGRSAPA